MDMNFNQYVGRLAETPRYYPSRVDEQGRTIAARATARLIVNRIPGHTSRGDDGGKYDAIPIVGWGPHAETMRQYTAKGKEIGVTGKLRHNATRRQDGGWDNFYEVQIDCISLGHDSSATKTAKAAAESGLTLAQMTGDPEALLNHPKIRERLRQLGHSARLEDLSAPDNTPAPVNPFLE